MGVKGQETGTTRFLTKWFQGFGPATFAMQMNLGKSGMKQLTDGSLNQHIYVTQEPLAPWLQIELCERDNDGQGAKMGLFDKRFAGSTGMTYETFQQIYAMGVQTQSIGYDTTTREALLPGTVRGFTKFSTGSFWRSNSRFNYTALKTITLLVRPNATLSEGQCASIFQFMNPATMTGTGLFLKRDNQGYYLEHWFASSANRRVPVITNDWNFIVLQFQGNSIQLNDVTCHASSYGSLKTDTIRNAFFKELQSKQSFGGNRVYGTAIQDPANAGHLMLGSTSVTVRTACINNIGFTGDVAWIHGFNHFLDTQELLTKEVEQRWIRRWS